ncbi:MAG: LytTR family DNA-binding domain-containing protein [Clostridia bacterium]
MNIAVCDDLEDERRSLIGHLHAYFNSATVREFENGAELVAAHAKERFDLMLLDMLMPGLNGIETAEKIRAFDDQTPIVFVTSTEDFALQSYRVLAFDYLLKPVTTDAMQRCLARFVKYTPDQRFLTVDYLGVRTDILLCNIIYLESDLRKVHLILSGSKTLSLTAKLDRFFSLTAEPDFCRCHKSFIVNLNHVEAIEGENFRMTDGSMIRISRTYLNDAKKAYFRYAFGKETLHGGRSVI